MLKVCSLSHTSLMNLPNKDVENIRLWENGDGNCDFNYVTKKKKNSALAFQVGGKSISFFDLTLKFTKPMGVDPDATHKNLDSYVPCFP